MKLSLKKVQIYPKLSEETNAFTAQLCLDGKPVAEVDNSGKGSSHGYRWLKPELRESIEAWVEAQPLEFVHDRLDQVIDRLLDDFEEKRKLKLWCKTKTVYRLKDTPEGEWILWSVPFTPEAKASLVRKYGRHLGRVANEELARKA